ncbi:unnamed protein product [Rhizoctonia solani]|uniref:BTB domain-containing protein n=1 Tax=Rhizoctonia solani TaxID=456999 RepID=A0A8H3D320_9AGAM|nr:unnamed protein product [Rhizoctonia solani]
MFESWSEWYYSQRRDVVIKVEQTLKLHQDILERYSPFFRDMFSIPTPDVLEGTEEQPHVPPSSAKIFDLCKFIYLGTSAFVGIVVNTSFTITVKTIGIGIAKVAIAKVTIIALSLVLALVSINPVLLALLALLLLVLVFPLFLVFIFVFPTRTWSVRPPSVGATRGGDRGAVNSSRGAPE